MFLGFWYYVMVLCLHVDLDEAQLMGSKNFVAHTQ